MLNPVNPSSHVDLMSMISRCLSGEWLIEPAWLMHHASTLLHNERQQVGTDKKPACAKIHHRQTGEVVMASDKLKSVGKNELMGQVHILGPIYKYGSWYAYGSKDYAAILSMMARDERVGGVKLVVDSPGGMASGTRELYELILNYPKPILLAVDGYMASAAYYLGAGASRIVATQPTDQIGSIGSIGTYVDLKGYYESFGVKIYETYAADSSEKNEAYRQVVESEGKNRALMLQSLKVLNDQFVADMKAARGSALNAKAGDPFKGRLYYATEAVAVGLADELVGDGDTLGLLADMIATNQRSSISMNFSSFLSGLKGLITQAEQGGETPETAQTTAPAATTAAEQVAALTEQVTTLTTERDTLSQQVTTLTTQVQTLTTERDQARQEAEQYGNQPGATPTQTTKAKDDVPAESKGEPTLEAFIDGLESTQKAKENGLW